MSVPFDNCNQTISTKDENQFEFESNFWLDILRVSFYLICKFPEKQVIAFPSALDALTVMPKVPVGAFSGMA